MYFVGYLMGARFFGREVLVANKTARAHTYTQTHSFTHTHAHTHTHRQDQVMYFVGYLMGARFLGREVLETYLSRMQLDETTQRKCVCVCLCVFVCVCVCDVWSSIGLRDHLHGL